MPLLSSLRSETILSSTRLSPSNNNQNMGRRERLSSIRQGSAREIKYFLSNAKVELATKTNHRFEQGITKKNDRFANTQTEALLMLQEMIHAAKKVEERKSIYNRGPIALGKNKWDLPWTPMTELDVTIEDVLIAFCKWARVDVVCSPKNSLRSSSTATSTINVSKAFRRLETYTTWMKDNRKILEEPLTVESVSEAAKAFGFRLTHDKQERLLCWFDMNQVDLDALDHRKNIPVVDSVRYLVWLSHVCMFDKRAQENGMMMIQNFAKISLWKLGAVFPNDTRIQLSRMTIGCLPIKMKKIYIMDAATWTNVIVNMMKPFMGQKVRQRMVVIGKKDSPQSVVSNIVGGYENILTPFSGLSGTQDKDIIFGKYLVHVF